MTERMNVAAAQYVPGNIPAMPANKSAELLHAIDRLRSRSSEEFQNHLEERKLQERKWANFSRDEECPAAAHGTNEQLRANSKWYVTTRLSHKYVDRWLANRVPGKIVLDYACGNGGQALKAARMGAALAIGIDVSDVSIRNATAAAGREGLSGQCIFVEGDCEETGLPADSIDVILCFGMLHHLDLTHAYSEMCRILKPGGCVFAMEALNYNPLIRLYRKLTPDLRTEWEKDHILSLKDIRAAKHYFNVGEIRYWHLTSVFGVLVHRIPPLFRACMPILNGIDRAALATPALQLMAWQFSFELFKPGP